MGTAAGSTTGSRGDLPCGPHTQVTTHSTGLQLDQDHDRTWALLQRVSVAADGASPAVRCP